MRRCWVGAAVVVLVAGCGHPPQHRPESSGSATPSSRINPANISRVRGAMPPGYEVRGVTGVSSRAAQRSNARTSNAETGAAC
ncbi:hypothetical protein C1Y40_00873 [Mycobacterium talmoniae]|uniref:Uncharacterized protein n=1 Tax=Mycobacterium talmoniae TaxID=1858794 RepID=A0A2S8BQK6_9MYCO|nr:hypothetical protein C1Y40_00873 [Mycobacterium talmoniae]